MLLLIIVFLIILVLPYFVGKYTTFLEQPNSCGMFGNICLGIIIMFSVLLCRYSNLPSIHSND